MPPGVSLSDFYYILPELVHGGALLVLIADVVLPKDRRAALAWVTLAALGATAASSLRCRYANACRRSLTSNALRWRSLRSGYMLSRLQPLFRKHWGKK